MSRIALRLIALLLLGLGNLASAVADVKLSKVFGDHMVLQQEQPIRVFGRADPAAVSYTHLTLPTILLV